MSAKETTPPHGTERPAHDEEPQAPETGAPGTAEPAPGETTGPMSAEPSPVETTRETAGEDDGETTRETTREDDEDPSAEPEKTELTLAYLRSRTRRQRGEKRRESAYVLYCVVIFALFWGAPYLLAIGRAADQQRWHGPTAQRVLDALPATGPLLLALVLLVVVRRATWSGPVRLDLPSVAWLLPQPLLRAPLLLPRLRVSAAISGSAGAALGGVAGHVLHALGGGTWWALVLAGAAVGAATGLLGTALGTLAQRHHRALLDRRRAVGAVAAACTAMLAVPAAASLAAGRSVVGEAVAWSGPWGWPLLPLAALGGGSDRPGTPSAVAGAVLTCLALAGAWWLARGAVVHVPSRVLRLQAGARYRFTAALYASDPSLVRSAVRSARVAGYRPAPQRSVRWPREGGARSRLLIPARDATALLRAPALLVKAAAWCAAAVVLWSLGDLPWGVRLLALPAAAIAAGQLAEGARLDGDDSRRGAQLPWPARRLALLHGALPATALTAGLLLGVAAAVAATGGRPGLLLLPAVGPALAAAAVLSAYRGVMPTEYLVGSETPVGNTGPAQALLWYLRGPLIAILLLAPAVVLWAGAPERGISVPVEVVSLLWAAGTAAVMAAWARATAARAARAGG